MTELTYESQLFDIDDAILNEEFEGFKEDYLILHSLIRKYRPKTFFEIGTNMGTGTNIICNAMYNQNPHNGVEPVYTLDLPTELAHISLQHPISEGKGDNVGSCCTFPFTQLRGDSLKFNFTEYPCEGYFIDGEHDWEHPWHETLDAALDGKAKIIIWHDADIPEVWKGIEQAIREIEMYNIYYKLFRVTGTRIAYAIK